MAGAWTREGAIAAQRAIEHAFTPDQVYRLYVCHLYRKALKGSRGRAADVLHWRTIALSIRLQFEAHSVQSNNVARSAHLKRLEDIAKEWEDAQPMIEPTAPDGTKWQRHFARRNESDLEYAARLAFTRDRDEDFATIDKDWYSDAYEMNRSESPDGYAISSLTVDAMHIDPTLAEREARIIEHNQERLAKQKERAARTPSIPHIPPWRADVGGNLELAGLPEPSAPVPPPDKAMIPLLDGVSESEVQLQATKSAKLNESADEIIECINRGELVAEGTVLDMRHLPTERIMDIRDALLNSMLEKRHALADAMKKRKQLDTLVATGMSELEAQEALEAKGFKLESVNRLLTKPNPLWQGLDLSGPGHH